MLLSRSATDSNKPAGVSGFPPSAIGHKKRNSLKSKPALKPFAKKLMQGEIKKITRKRTMRINMQATIITAVYINDLIV